MDPIMSMVQLFAISYDLENWKLCDGRLLAITQNQAIFALLGNTFGGDGTSTFALPDLRGQAPKGLHYFIAVNGTWPSRP